MGRTATYSDHQAAINELRAALAVIDNANGRIPSSVNDPREAAAFVREADVRTSQTTLNEAHIKEQNAKGAIDELVASFQTLPVNSVERDAKHAEALKAFDTWMQLQTEKSVATGHHLVIIEAMDRRARFR